MASQSKQSNFKNGKAGLSVTEPFNPIIYQTRQFEKSQSESSFLGLSVQVFRFATLQFKNLSSHTCGSNSVM